MPSPISTIRNLGQAAEADYAAAGLHSAEAIRALGADEAYLRLLLSGKRPHFIAYYTLVLGLQGRPWNDCDAREKAALRLRFDAIRNRAADNEKGRSPMEAALAEIGVLNAQPTSSRPEKK